MEKSTLTYRGPYPSLQFYTSFSDNRKTIEKKRQFLESCKDLIFWAPIETLKYCLQDTILLMTGGLAFQMEAVSIQMAFHKIFNFQAPTDRLEFLLPFCSPFVSLGGFR